MWPGGSSQQQCLGSWLPHTRMIHSGPGSADGAARCVQSLSRWLWGQVVPRLPSPWSWSPPNTLRGRKKWLEGGPRLHQSSVGVRTRGQASGAALCSKGREGPLSVGLGHLQRRVRSRPPRQYLGTRSRVAAVRSGAQLGPSRPRLLICPCGFTWPGPCRDGVDFLRRNRVAQGCPGGARTARRDSGGCWWWVWALPPVPARARTG